jgi:predicted  nucleic acid-binding Zn-ribbon protein
MMTDEPIYYTEQELNDLFNERAAYAERMKAIGKEVQGLMASRHHLIAKMGAVADQQAQVAKQAHEAGSADLKSVFELNEEMDALFNEWHTTEAKLDELKSELTHSRNMMDDILKDTLRDPRMRKLYDEMKDK